MRIAVELDGYRIDFMNGKVALDFEWNIKNQTYPFFPLPRPGR